jgi:hypothetical protein
LKRATLEEWEKIEIEVINKYTGRMEDIVEAVRKAKGGHTRF